MEDFIESLGIYLPGEYASDGSYVIDLQDSDEFGRYYTKLANSDILEEESTSSIITEDNSSYQFSSDDYTVTLIADFLGDTYKIVVR